MDVYHKIVDGQAKLSVIGLGYVGMPLAIAFAKKVGVIGYDISEKVISGYLKGEDPTNEVGSEGIIGSGIHFTCDETILREALFHIVSVPTPINSDKTPDLKPVESASKTVGRNLTSGSIVVYESTVYPGVTEDVCIPLLEHESGLRAGKDFFVGYSPERINPGDKEHRLENIMKIVSGMDSETLDEVSKVYELVVSAGVHRARSIKVAEAAKVAENSQRDINIAFINELAMAFNKMDIDTKDVLDAMGTKWNSLGFRPGLVGGHCIGVDPYYFLYEAEKLGYHSQIISSSRRVNNSVPKFVAEQIIVQLIASKKVVSDARVAILGVTFKENCPDVRNSKVMEIVGYLHGCGISPILVDPCADDGELFDLYGYHLTDIQDVRDLDCVVIAVSHQKFRSMNLDDIDALFKPLPPEGKVIVDIKSILDNDEIRCRGYGFWRL
ncbi:nucleotide sugar dehydrogenase [Ruminococcaceae bacterium OttesenSCG-928-A11]|nr:nucleotide sugar dehydrogenase [Ruminococcaceae bacterium OttesenSCG-928-A11]